MNSKNSSQRDNYLTEKEINISIIFSNATHNYYELEKNFIHYSYMLMRNLNEPELEEVSDFFNLMGLNYSAVLAYALEESEKIQNIKQNIVGKHNATIADFFKNQHKYSINTQNNLALIKSRKENIPLFFMS